MLPEAHDHPSNAASGLQIDRDLGNIYIREEAKHLVQVLRVSSPVHASVDSADDRSSGKTSETTFEQRSVTGKPRSKQKYEKHR